MIASDLDQEFLKKRADKKSGFYYRVKRKTEEVIKNINRYAPP